MTSALFAVSSCSISTVYLLFVLAVFLSQEEHHDLLPLNGNNFTIFVHGNKQHGVVGLQGALITCFICDHQCHNCEHVTKVTESEENSKTQNASFSGQFFLLKEIFESLLNQLQHPSLVKSGK